VELTDSSEPVELIDHFEPSEPPTTDAMSPSMTAVTGPRRRSRRGRPHTSGHRHW
jgi:hypothetical protein